MLENQEFETASAEPSSYAIAAFNGVESKPRHKKLTWDQIKRQLSTFTPMKGEARPDGRIKTPKSAPCFVGGRFRDESNAEGSNLVARSLAVLDYDDCPDELEMVEFALEMWGHRCFAYSTWSNTADKAKFRVSVPLAHEVSADQYPGIARALVDEIGLDGVDPASFNPVLKMFEPAYEIGTDYDEWTFDGDGAIYRPAFDDIGDTFDTPSRADDLEITVAYDPLDVSDQEVGKALDLYPAEGLDYDEWISVGLALWHQYQGDEGDAGFGRWLKWSERSSKHDAKGMRKKWKSGGGRAQPITMASVFAKVGGLQAVRDALRADGVDVAPRIKGKGALQWLDELDREPPRFTVEGIIPVDCLIAIFGQPKHGKSFVAIDLSYCVGTGTPYHGRAVEKGFVVYVAGEGKRGTIARFDALAVHHGAPLDGIALRSGIPLNQEGSADHIIAEVRAAMAERGLGNPAMIVIDTLKRNFAGDQNASKDMSVFVKSCDTIREAFPDSSVVVVNHSTHAEKDRMGGSIDLLAALDAEYKVEKKDGRVVVTNTNMKDAEEVEPFAFDFRGYDLSHGRDAPVLIPADLPQKSRPVGKNEALAIDAYNDAARLHEGAGAKLEDVRRIFCDRHESDNQSTKRGAFYRERDKLFEDKGDGIVTIPGKITDDDFDIG